MASNVDDRSWSTLLSLLPAITGVTVDEFVRQQAIAKETSIRGYKFFLESYIHDVQGWFCLRDYYLLHLKVLFKV
jgi:hypothetical protein